MKIFEVTQQDTNPNFDLVDDASFYMRNDPEFYRKSYFPAMAKVADLHRNGKSINPHKCLGGMVEKGISKYCQKYDMAKHPEEVFTQDQREELIDRLFAEEMEQIKQGEYKWN